MEDEMVYIAKFAKELKIDSINFQKLRIEKYSPLKEVIENTPGYYYTELGGHVYSDQYSTEELKKIRKRIKKGFYDYQQIWEILKKGFQVKLISKSYVTYVFPKLPKLLFRLLKREIEKKRQSRERSKRLKDKATYDAINYLELNQREF
jgi:hypothetical protein